MLSCFDSAYSCCPVFYILLLCSSVLVLSHLCSFIFTALQSAHIPVPLHTTLPRVLLSLVAAPLAASSKHSTYAQAQDEMGSDSGGVVRAKGA